MTQGRYYNINRDRLFYDIETSPNIGLFWRPGYKLSIPYENIIKERAIICISYKWAGKKVQHLTWDKNQCDEKMIASFSKILIKANESVAHNGDKFDIKWIRGRALKYGISMPPDLITIDTCKLSRSLFNLNSNRLDYLGEYLEVGRKMKTGGFDLWKEVLLERNPIALKKMVRYCDKDVILLEKVYNKMKPYIKSRTTCTSNRIACPECGGNTIISKHSTRATGSRVTQLKCSKCGKFHTIPTSVLEKAQRYQNG